MTTGEIIAFLRKKIGITQEQMAEILGVSRQSVSRWEIDMAFPETEKLIKLSKLLRCSIDYLLNDQASLPQESDTKLSIRTAYEFIRDCGYFFLATTSDSKPNQRPMGMIYCDEEFLYIATDKRKKLFSEILENPNVSLASYNLHTRKWIRVSARAVKETSITVYQEMVEMFPGLKQKYIGEEEVFFVILKLCVDAIEMD